MKLETKVVELYTYRGLGWPIELTDVTMVYFNKEWVPKIDVRRVADDQFVELSNSDTELTRAQKDFIRGYHRWANEGGGLGE